MHMNFKFWELRFPKLFLAVQKSCLQGEKFNIQYTLLIRRVRLIGMALPWKGSNPKGF